MQCENETAGASGVGRFRLNISQRPVSYTLSKGKPLSSERSMLNRIKATGLAAEKMGLKHGRTRVFLKWALGGNNFSTLRDSVLRLPDLDSPCNST